VSVSAINHYHLSEIEKQYSIIRYVMTPPLGGDVLQWPSVDTRTSGFVSAFGGKADANCQDGRGSF
jgi:hypothetical protein